MHSRRQRHIAGGGILGSAFHYFGKKLNGETAVKQPGLGWEYYRPDAVPDYSRNGAKPDASWGPYNHFGFGGSGLKRKWRKRSHKSKRRR